MSTIFFLCACNVSCKHVCACIFKYKISASITKQNRVCIIITQTVRIYCRACEPRVPQKPFLFFIDFRCGNGDRNQYERFKIMFALTTKTVYKPVCGSSYFSHRPPSGEYYNIFLYRLCSEDCLCRVVLVNFFFLKTYYLCTYNKRFTSALYTQHHRSHTTS